MSSNSICRAQSEGEPCETEMWQSERVPTEEESAEQIGRNTGCSIYEDTARK